MLERLRADMRDAMKRRDTAALGVLRMVLADVHNRQIDAGGELDDDQVVEVLRKAVKQRHEAAEQFEQGGRDDRAAAERAEAELLGDYLPRMLDADELAAAVDAAIAETGASAPSDMGQVMGELMSRHRGLIDGKAANALVRERLSGS